MNNAVMAKLKFLLPFKETVYNQALFLHCSCAKQQSDWTLSNINQTLLLNYLQEKRRTNSPASVTRETPGRI